MSQTSIHLLSPAAFADRASDTVSPSNKPRPAFNDHLSQATETTPRPASNTPHHDKASDDPDFESGQGNDSSLPAEAHARPSEEVRPERPAAAATAPAKQGGREKIDPAERAAAEPLTTGPNLERKPGEHVSDANDNSSVQTEENEQEASEAATTVDMANTARARARAETSAKQPVQEATPDVKNADDVEIPAGQHARDVQTVQTNVSSLNDNARTAEPAATISEGEREVVRQQSANVVQHPVSTNENGHSSDKPQPDEQARAQIQLPSAATAYQPEIGRTHSVHPQDAAPSDGAALLRVAASHDVRQVADQAAAGKESPSDTGSRSNGVRPGLHSRDPATVSHPSAVTTTSQDTTGDAVGEQTLQRLGGPPAEAVEMMGDRPAASSIRAQSWSALEQRGEAASADDGPPVDAARFIGRVARAFQTAHQRGGTLQLRLSPPELGSLRLELTVQDGVLTAALETETTAARRLLLDHLPALRDRLAEQNIRVERFDVDVRRDSGGGQADDRAFQQQPREKPPELSEQRRQSASQPRAGDTVQDDAPIVQSISGGTGLNIFA